MGAELLNFTLSYWFIGVIPSAAAISTIPSTTTIPSAAISTTTAAGGYILIAFICVFWRALAPFVFFIFGGHRSYF